MKTRIFYIIYWLMRHYIPHLIIAALIIGTCLTSCRTTQHHFTDVSKTIVHDTVTITRDRITDISANTRLHYEQTILDLQTRIDSVSGRPWHDTVRITHTVIQRADTVHVHHLDTLYIAASHIDSTAIHRQEATTTDTRPSLWSDLIIKLLILSVVWMIILLTRRSTN